MKKTFSFTIVLPTATRLAGKLFHKHSIKVAKCSADDDDYYSPTDWERDPTESDTDYEERTQDLTDCLEGNLDIINRRNRRPDPRLVAGAIKQLNVRKAARVFRVASFVVKNAKFLRLSPMIFCL